MSEQTPVQYRRRRKQSLFSDPVVLTLSILIAGIVISALLFLAVSLGMGYIGGRAPRNIAEAELVATTINKNENPEDLNTYYLYIKSLANQKQFSQAQQAIKEGAEKFKETDDYDFYILSAQAYLFFRQENYPKAVEQAQIAQKNMQEAYDAELKSDKDPNRAKSYGISDNYNEMSLIIAGAYTATEDYDKAIAELEAYLVTNPREAGVWVDLGNLYAKVGNKEKAIEAYDEALYFIPDYADAINGKAELGAE